MDTFCVVRVQSTEHGISHAVARNISDGGVFIETHNLLPIGSALRIWFDGPDGIACISALGEVKNHYLLRFMQGGNPMSLTGIGVKFVRFEVQPKEPRWRPGSADATVH